MTRSITDVYSERMQCLRNLEMQPVNEGGGMAWCWQAHALSCKLCANLSNLVLPFPVPHEHNNVVCELVVDKKVHLLQPLCHTLLEHITLRRRKHGVELAQPVPGGAGKAPVCAFSLKVKSRPTTH